MLTKSLAALMLVGVCVAFPSYQESDHHSSGQVGVPQPPTLQHGHGSQPVPLGPQDLNQQRPHAENSDLKTDASTWWKSWNRWGNSYGYSSPSYTYSSPSYGHGYGYSNPSYSYSHSSPVVVSTKTHYVYTPKTYTYYEPQTYSTYWTESQPHYSSHSHHYQAPHHYENQW